jgi:hypothetical protein
MLKVSAKCKECGQMPYYWGEFSAQGEERKRRLYSCRDHLNEVFRGVLEL